MGASLSDDGLLLLLLVPEDDFKATQAAGPISKEFSGAGKPLSAFISIQKEDFSLTLE
jgi:hypothetical protein